MAYAKPTLVDLLQGIADRHDDGVLPTDSATLSKWTRWINRGIRYCTDKLRTNSPESLTTSGGTVACPTGFLTIHTVYNSSNIPLYQIDQQVSTGATGLVFWIAGDFKTGFTFNVPTDQDGTFTANMAQKPDPLVNNTDICDIPDEEAVVAYAYSFIRKGETDPIGDADASLQECDNRLMEMQSAQNVNDGGLCFSFNV
jgi:hypothetical protein